jgi:hypothetical protein
VIFQQGSVYWEIPPFWGRISADDIQGKKYEKGGERGKGKEKVRKGK